MKIFSLFVVALTLTGLPYGANAAPGKRINSPADKHTPFIMHLRDQLEGKLKDYTTARFRNVRMTEGEWVCGYVNAKSSAGGYTGWEPFIAGHTKDADAFVIIGTGGITSEVLDCEKDDSKWLPKDYSDDVTYHP